MKPVTALLAATVLAAGAHAEGTGIAAKANAALGTAEGVLERVLEDMLRPEVVTEKHAEDSSPASPAPGSDASLPTDQDERSLHEQHLELPGLDGTQVSAVADSSPAQHPSDDDASIATDDNNGNDNENGEEEDEEEDTDDEQEEEEAPPQEGDEPEEEEDEDEEAGAGHEMDMPSPEEPRPMEVHEMHELPAPLQHALMAALMGGPVHPSIASLPASHPIVLHLRFVGHPSFAHAGGITLGHVPTHQVPFHLEHLHLMPMGMPMGMPMHMHMPMPMPMMMHHLQQGPSFMHMLPMHLRMMHLPMHMMPMHMMPMHMLQMHMMPMHALQMHMLPPPAAATEMKGLDLASFLSGLENAVDGPSRSPSRAPASTSEVEEISFHNGVGSVHRYGTRADGSKYDIVEPLGGNGENNNNNNKASNDNNKVLKGEEAVKAAIADLNAKAEAVEATKH